MNKNINTQTFNLTLYEKNNDIHNKVLIELWNDNNTQKYLYNKDEFINNIIDGNGKYNCIYMANIDNNYIGFISLYFYDNTYEVSDGILKEFRGKGYSTKLLKEFCEYVFNNTTISELYGYIDETNVASIKSATKVGFVKRTDKEYILTKNTIE